MAFTAEEETRIKALEEAIAKTRSSAEFDVTGREGAQPSDAIMRRLTELVSEKNHELKDTGDYPLWKPLDFTQLSYPGFQGMGGDALRKGLVQIFAGKPELQKAVDTVAIGPLIRQDLDPRIYELYVKRFPFWDLLEKQQSNGLVHVYNQQTGFGDAQFMTELGTVTDDSTTYVRGQANIAVLATRRGISLKAINAVVAGGVNYDPEQREINGGLNALRRKTQVAIMRMQDTNAGAVTATDPDGLYDANAFNGLRYILKNLAPAANTVTVDITGGDTTQLLATAVRKAANVVIDNGGEPSLIVSAVGTREFVMQEMIQFVRFDTSNSTEIVPGVRVPKIVAGEAELPYTTIPGDSIGSYIIGGQTFVDIFVLDMDMLGWAWLGGPGPTVLEIPVGTDGTLRKLFIPFMMGGLINTAPLFCARVKVRIA